MLVLVDTNVYLDFYRAHGADSSMSLLDKLVSASDHVISTSVVFDEFMRNRQSVLIDARDGLVKLANARPQIPTLLRDQGEGETLKASYAEAAKAAGALRDSLDEMIRNPKTGDRVYAAVATLVDDARELCLTPKNEEWSNVLAAARARYELGQPPRKHDATSLGDLINWEWAVLCCKRRRSSLIVVSRDSDYGGRLGKAPLINDHLSSEFQGVVGSTRSVRLTDRLSDALPRISVTVSKSERKAENRLADFTRLAEHMRSLPSTELKLRGSAGDFLRALNEYDSQMKGLLSDETVRKWLDTLIPKDDGSGA